MEYKNGYFLILEQVTIVFNIYKHVKYLYHLYLRENYILRNMILYFI